MSLYLAPSDYGPYGLPASATQAQVMEASTYVDSYLRRPEGLVWMPDWAGNPAYMANLSPKMTLTLAAPIQPGASVVASVTPASYYSPDTVGEVLVIDRATAGTAGNVCEACAIALGNPAPGQIMLANVTQPHAAGALLEAGLAIEETRQILHQRSCTSVTRKQFVRLLSGVGRFGYGRKSDIVAGTYNEVNLLATLSTFGGPPQWNPFDVTQTSVNYVTGEMWIPAGILLAYFTDVRVWYVAGFAAGAIPDPVKRATARIRSASSP